MNTETEKKVAKKVTKVASKAVKVQTVVPPTVEEHLNNMKAAVMAARITFGFGVDKKLIECGYIAGIKVMGVPPELCFEIIEAL